MNAITTSHRVGQIVAEHPHVARVFEELNIDYCCGGKRPLIEVCRERGLDAGQLVERLVGLPEPANEPQEKDWTTATLAELCDHIVHEHHDYLREELPRLTAIIAKVVHAHGARDSKLAEVQKVFAALRNELEPHMIKEEIVLFPSIRALEARSEALPFPFGSLANPIRVMISDHDHAGDDLARLRELTGDYVPPASACNTYRVMLDGLATLERDMHQHVHKENNILFPRAIALEQRLGTDQQAAAEFGCGCAHA